MAILDIRNFTQEEIIGIRFDSSEDVLQSFPCGLAITNRDEYKTLCQWKDFDNFIAACHKARELWGPK